MVLMHSIKYCSFVATVDAKCINCFYLFYLAKLFIVLKWILEMRNTGHFPKKESLNSLKTMNLLFNQNNNHLLIGLIGIRLIGYKTYLSVFQESNKLSRSLQG